MALLTPQSVVTTGTTPSAVAASASDTLPGATAGPNGWFVRAITTGTASNISVLDPNFTALSNPGTVTPTVLPATGARMILVPRSAINSSGVATITSTSQTGLTYEIYTA